jgi:hypothetical protein
MDRKIPKYWQNANEFDWRDYVEIEEGEFSKEQEQQIETVLYELSQLPEFQETLISTQKPHIKQAWGDIIETLNTYHPTELSLKDFPKITLIKTGGEEAIALGGGKEGHWFTALGRSIQIDFPSLGRVDIPDQNGKLYTLSLQHVLVHEFNHSASLNEYICCRAFLRSVLESSRNGLENDSIREAYKSIIVAKLEPHVIAATNQIMVRYYNEPCRKDYGNGYRNDSQPQENFMATLTIDCNFPLPILAHTEITYEVLNASEIEGQLSHKLPHQSKPSTSKVSHSI